MSKRSSQWEQIFPTKCSLFVFLLYMALFINQGIMVTASQRADSSYSYSTVTVVLLSETTKLVASVIFYIRENRISTLFSDIKTHFRVLVLYMVPAMLYCIYNNLAFINLSAYDPTTYFLLLQFRVVITGIIFQVLFKKQLSKWQWASLCILTLGCIIKQMNVTEKTTTSAPGAEHSYTNVLSALFSVHTGLVLLQVLCSCFAGVYNEKLLKDIGVDVHIMVQNVFMYVDSILCNAVILLLRGELVSAFTYDALSQIWQPTVIIIIANNAAVGIVTSFFLKNLNSIMKTFASALELMFTAVLSWLIFGMPIGWWSAVAIVLVTYASWMYAQNPVVNRGRLDEKQNIQEMEEKVNLMESGTPSDV